LSDKPFAESCVENRAPILAVLREVFADRRHVLEIGSGTGQHACISCRTPHSWQTADVRPTPARAWLPTRAAQRCRHWHRRLPTTGAGPLRAVFSPTPCTS
jgi:hypothetical protein